PAWPVAFFGILYAGATVVPVDAGIDPRTARVLADASGARIFVSDAKVRGRLAADLSDVSFWDMLEALSPPAAHRPNGTTPSLTRPSDDAVAALIYTSGTTGSPKGVMLTHANLTALIASLAPLFPLGSGDRVLSVLPLHHTFELTCGVLLPLSRGARVIYLDELNGERLERGLKERRAPALIGVPAAWEMLGRRVPARVAARGGCSSGPSTRGSAATCAISSAAAQPWGARPTGSSRGWGSTSRRATVSRRRRPSSPWPRAGPGRRPVTSARRCRASRCASIDR